MKAKSARRSARCLLANISPCNHLVSSAEVAINLIHNSACTSLLAPIAFEATNTLGELPPRGEISAVSAEKLGKPRPRPARLFWRKAIPPSPFLPGLSVFLLLASFTDKRPLGSHPSALVWSVYSLLPLSRQLPFFALLPLSPYRTYLLAITPRHVTTSYPAPCALDARVVFQVDGPKLCFNDAHPGGTVETYRSHQLGPRPSWACCGESIAMVPEMPTIPSSIAFESSLQTPSRRELTPVQSYRQAARQQDARPYRRLREIKW